MNTEERLRVLRATRELGSLSHALLLALLPHFDEQCVSTGAQLALEGRLAHQFLIVASGSLETCRRGRAGKLGRGDTFGWRAMHDRGVNEASVTALSEAHLLLMSHEQFRAVDGLAV
ncbi:MAG TPA: cyclic nucleotide-binding domain-containing protein [Candidatus Dormibacteraeota bacterium]|nr:cyclic nucleotide-binding domain-containing protein [Candidatus Dormibacteraeota bacterium]